MAERIVRVDVDTQVGFCSSAGGLYVKGAEAVVPIVAALNADAVRRGLPLIGSVDTHESHSREFRQNGGIWPVHCVKGTQDWLKLPETLPPSFFILAAVPYPSDALAMRDGAALYFEKDRYSLFDNPNADPVVRRLGGVDTVFQVYGVATDYCVRAAILGIRERSPDSRIQLVTDAVAGVAEETTAAALAELQAAGVQTVLSRELL